MLSPGNTRGLGITIGIGDVIEWWHKVQYLGVKNLRVFKYIGRILRRNLIGSCDGLSQRD